jgi:uncharacterized membrane protein YjjP (DUF1212 family)
MPGLEHVFLIRCAQLLHCHGTPAHRLERVMADMAGHLGVQATFLYTPTSVFASFGAMPDEETHLLRVGETGLDLGKLVELDEVMEDVEHRRIDLAAGMERLERIAAAPPRWGAGWKALAFALASAGAARFFGGGVAEIVVSAALGPVMLALGNLLARRKADLGLFEPLAAFIAAGSALLIARHGTPIDDRVVILASLIVLIPGLTLTTAMTELATRHLVSGVSRFAGAAVVFLTILLGVALAWRLGDGPVATDESGAVALAPWTIWCAVAVTPLAFAIILEARVRELPVIYGTSVLGFLAARACATTLGSDLSPFVGALVVGVLANLYARWADRPSLVPLTPGILLLVPGSLGYRSLTSFLEREALTGMDWAFQTGIVAVALVGGILASNIVLPPRRVL